MRTRWVPPRTSQVLQVNCDGVTRAQVQDIATTDRAVTKFWLEHSHSSWLPACQHLHPCTCSLPRVRELISKATSVMKVKPDSQLVSPGLHQASLNAVQLPVALQSSLCPKMTGDGGQCSGISIWLWNALQTWQSRQCDSPLVCVEDAAR